MLNYFDISLNQKEPKVAPVISLKLESKYSVIWLKNGHFTFAFARLVP